MHAACGLNSLDRYAALPCTPFPFFPQLGLAAPPPLPLAGGAGCTPRSRGKPDVTFKAVGVAAKAACKWRRAAQGELGADESLMHDACTIIERRTMSRWVDGRAASDAALAGGQGR